MCSKARQFFSVPFPENHLKMVSKTNYDKTGNLWQDCKLNEMQLKLNQSINHYFHYR